MRFLPSKLFSTRTPEEKRLRRTVYSVTGFRPTNLALYNLALQHKSAVSKGFHSNERLEFLGDAVLSLIVAEFLFKKYPLKEEGFLTDIRSRIVNRASMIHLAKKIGIDTLLHYEKETLRRGALTFICGNALEALIGAVYLDKGYKKCRKFVIDRLVHIHIDLEALIQNDTNYKSQLITWGNRSRKNVHFITIAEDCLQGSREFIVQVLIGEKVMGQGRASNKKQAEQRAAQAALSELNNKNVLT